MDLKSSSVLTIVVTVLFCHFPCVDPLENQGCRGVPKDEAEGIQCFLESDDSLTSPPTRVDCSLNFNAGDKLRFRCEEAYKAASLTLTSAPDEDSENDENVWIFSKCLGFDEWSSFNSTFSLTNFRCQLNKGFFDQEDKSALISGGVKVTVKSMPWVAGIFKGAKLICGGTLVDKSFVLTAAHCTALNETVAIGPLPPEQFTVVVGSSSGIFSQAIDRALNPHAQTFKVVQILMHPNYTGAPNYFNDIAILQLEKNVVVSKYVLAAGLPKLPIRSIQDGGLVLQVNGFGIFTNESYNPSAKLLATNVTTKHFEDCAQHTRKFDRARQFCTTPTNGEQSESGICEGDSGSGAYVTGRYIWSIQGVVSFGTKASQLFKGCHNVTFFTKVEFYKPWIAEETARLHQQFRYGQDSDKPPKVEVSSDGVKIKPINSTFTISHPRRRNTVVFSTILLTCLAPYPIKFVYEDAPFPRYDLLILQDDQSFVTYPDFFKPSTYMFKIRTSFQFHEFTRNTTFSCESIDGPKSRQIIEFSDNDWDDAEHDYRDVTFKIRPQTSGKNQSHAQGQIQTDSAVRVSNESCTAFFYYKEVQDPVSGFPTYAFKCELADGSPGTLTPINCPRRAKCQNYFDNIRPPKNCWRKWENWNYDRNWNDTEASRIKTAVKLIPFIPICGTEYGNSLGNEISLPVFYSLPGGFKSRPVIFFEGLQDGLETPGLFRNFSEISTKSGQSMIQMKDFGQFHLLNSVIQVVCRTSHYWTTRSFQFAVQLANETKLRILRVDENTDYDVKLNANIQVAQVKLNDSRIERIWCFGAIENTRDWLNASRPVKIFEKEWDLLEANRQCSMDHLQKQDAVTKQTNETIKQLPELQIEFRGQASTRSKKVVKGAPPLIINRFPRFGTDIHVVCEANYPIQIVQQVYNETCYYTYETSRRTNNGTIFLVSGYLFHDTTSQGRIIRCESLENPSVQSSLEYSYSKRDQQLSISFVDGLDDDVSTEPRISSDVAEVCKRSENEIENGRECDAIFYYEATEEFPFFRIHCEFPFGRIGEVKLHPCDSPSQCLNLYRNRRQSSKCLKKGAGCSPSSTSCPHFMTNPFCEYRTCDKAIVPPNRQPFVATCSRGTPGQPGYYETTWGSFVDFPESPMEDSGQESAAKLGTFFTFVCIYVFVMFQNFLLGH